MHKAPLLVVALIGALASGTTTAQAHETRTIPVPDRYSDQRISWAPCFDPANPPADMPSGGERLECGTYQAPQDWRRAAGSADITISVSRLRPASGEVKGSVLTNPGGPGGRGRTLPLSFLNQPKLLASQEIIGIDVRGTGESTNVTCDDYDWLDIADPRDRSPENVKLLFDTAEQQARKCQAGSGEFGKVVNTEQTVRDLDLLRHLLGRDKINWIGYSGGTWMGAFYATYFPQHVGKFVLDSNAEFTSSYQTVFGAFGIGFERRFRTDFLPWVAKYDSIYHLGTTGEEVRQSYEDIRTELVAHPLTQADGSVLTAVRFDRFLFDSLYSKYSFPSAAEKFSLVGNVVVDHNGSAPALGRFPDARNATMYATVCNDTPFRGDRDFLVRESARLGKLYPLIGGYVVAAPCAFWQRPALDLKTPTGRDVPPILMVQSVTDPATPIEGAQRAHRKFAGSRMLTVTNEGDHGLYAFGNGCVDNVVESFIVDQVVPERDLTCDGVPLPVPSAAPAQVADPLVRYTGLLK